MVKPATFDGYSDQYTLECERVLVTLLRGLGAWKESLFLVGGLTPRYLVAARPPDVPAHAGTLDVDVVIDLQILADTAGYRTLEENLRAMGFERSTNERGQRLSWRWQTRTESGALMVVELLADAPEIPVCASTMSTSMPGSCSIASTSRRAGTSASSNSRTRRSPARMAPSNRECRSRASARRVSGTSRPIRDREPQPQRVGAF